MLNFIKLKNIILHSFWIYFSGCKYPHMVTTEQKPSRQTNQIVMLLPITTHAFVFVCCLYAQKHADWTAVVLPIY